MYITSNSVCEYVQIVKLFFSAHKEPDVDC